MHSLQRKIREFQMYKNERLGREISLDLYKYLYSKSNGESVQFEGATLEFKQDKLSMENDLSYILYVLKTLKMPVEV